MFREDINRQAEVMVVRIGTRNPTLIQEIVKKEGLHG
jgi:hypothetical protein